MGAETSSPGGQQDVSFIDKDDEALEVAERALDTDALNPSLYGDYAGSSALSAQQKGLGSITGSKVVDALIPGVGALNLVSSLSAGYMQQSLQRGGSPVYGSRGTVEGVTNENNIFGVDYTTYSGNPDLDPNKQPNLNDSSSPEVLSVNTSAINKVVKAASTETSSYNSNQVVNASAASSSKRASRKGTILTSPQGDTTQLTTILKPGLKGTLG
tara:strand:+ start:116 stop:757 length:642 start_codon:yes stop_codon:yes gene_type:complete